MTVTVIRYTKPMNIYAFGGLWVGLGFVMIGFSLASSYISHR
jgi:hypothetical protein